MAIEDGAVIWLLFGDLQMTDFLSRQNHDYGGEVEKS
jgi:hypothetical protein